MKTWHIIALFGVLGLVIYAVTRSPAKMTTARSSYGINSPTGFTATALGSALGTFGAGLLSSGNKVAPPSAIPDDSAATASYNAITTPQLNDLAAADKAAGVEGPF